VGTSAIAVLGWTATDEKEHPTMRVLAYLDPGSGSMILQTILGGFAAAIVAIKMFGKRVFSTLMFWKRDDDEQAEKAETGAPATTASSARETEKEPV
jgi:hypothetical protein